MTEEKLVDMIIVDLKAPATQNLKITNIHGWAHDWNEEEYRADGGGGFDLRWASDAGFGGIRFNRDKDGKWTCDNECMSKSFIRALFEKLLDKCEMKDEDK